MIIEKLPMGWRITIPESDNNCEFSYDVPIVKDGPKHIRVEQEKIARKVAIRAYSMEQRFKNNEYDAWADKNLRGDPTLQPWLKWNEYFHDELASMVEDAWALWREWCDWHFETFGWNAY